MLLRAYQGLVLFSLHVVPLNSLLSECMDSEGNRDVQSHKLPNILSLSWTRQDLNASTLSLQEALFMGLIPALIHASVNNANLPCSWREKIITECLASALSVDKVNTLLETMLTGAASGVPKQLLKATHGH